MVHPCAADSTGQTRRPAARGGPAQSAQGHPVNRARWHRLAHAAPRSAALAHRARLLHEVAQGRHM